jgi:hypothetical protein
MVVIRQSRDWTRIKRLPFGLVPMEATIGSYLYNDASAWALRRF